MSSTFEVTPSELFLEDTRDALRYICGALHAPGAASKLMSSIDDASKLLSSNPYINAVSRSDFLKKREIRIHFVKNYLIAYDIREDRVRLLRLLHQSQAYDDTRYWDEE